MKVNGTAVISNSNWSLVGPAGDICRGLVSLVIAP
jgi:hypothetical protein